MDIDSEEAGGRAVVIAGYPKSGNTWLARLTAELLGCPVKGYFANPNHDELAVEGLERKSDYAVYKSHHSLLSLSTRVPIDDLIYIVRDVRDVVVSGADYFHFPLRSRWGRFVLDGLPPAIRWRAKRSILDSRRRRVREMTRVVGQGSDVVGGCALSWDSHVNEYLDSNAFFVRYEDLVTDTLGECQRLLSHLNVKRSIQQIERGIENQSFARVKKKFSERGDARNARFLRRGTGGAWRVELPASQVRLLEERFAPTLLRLGYPLERTK